MNMEQWAADSRIKEESILLLAKIRSVLISCDMVSPPCLYICSVAPNYG